MNQLPSSDALPTARRATRLNAFVIAALILAWLAATAWARPLLIPDEGRYVGVAWEMMRSGDWLTPTLNGLPYFHKPPLFYWISAASMSVFGVNEWAGRAAPLAGAWLGAFALFLFTRRWVGERAARYTLLALLAQPLWFIGGQFANLDMLVAGCIAATVLLLAHAAMSLEQGLPYRRALLGAYAMAALGILAKGLIGAVLPALVVILWLALTRRWRTLWAMVSLPGIAVFLLLAAPWFVAMQRHFPDFLYYFFVVQHFKRFASGGFNNPQPLWFYPVILMLVSLPWLPWLHRLFKSGYWSDKERAPLRILMWIWLIAIVGFFSLPKSKLLGYVLPAVVPLAFLIADGFLSRAAPTSRTRKLWWTSLAVSMTLCLVTIGGLTIYPRKSSPALARALGAQRGAHEPVYMLGQYHFSVPLYAGMLEPAHIVDDWSNPEVFKQDNWRKEVADAGQFDKPRAAAFLIEPDTLAAALCRSPVSWIIGPSAAVDRYPFLAHARVVFTQRELTLWKVEPAGSGLASELPCVSSTEQAPTGK